MRQELQETLEGSHASGQRSQTPPAIGVLNQGGHTQHCSEGRGHSRGWEGCGRFRERERGRERDTETQDEGEKEGRKTDSAPERSEGREREVGKIPNEDRAPEGKEPGRERETERQEGNRPPGKGGQGPKKGGAGGTMDK